MSKLESTQKEVTATEPEKFQTIKRVRTAPRKWDEETGPLAHVLSLTVPGYYLYLAVENDPDQPNIVQNLLRSDVAYDFVHPLETVPPAVEVDGSPMKGDRVKCSLKGGKVGVLLKLPLEYREEDLRVQKEKTDKGLHASNTTSNIAGTQSATGKDDGSSRNFDFSNLEERLKIG